MSSERLRGRLTPWTGNATTLTLRTPAPPSSAIIDLDVATPRLSEAFLFDGTPELDLSDLLEPVPQPITRRIRAPRATHGRRDQMLAGVGALCGIVGAALALVAQLRLAPPPEVASKKLSTRAESARSSQYLRDATDVTNVEPLQTAPAPATAVVVARPKPRSRLADTVATSRLQHEQNPTSANEYLVLGETAERNGAPELAIAAYRTYVRTSGHSDEIAARIERLSTTYHHRRNGLRPDDL